MFYCNSAVFLRLLGFVSAPLDPATSQSLAEGSRFFVLLLDPGGHVEAPGVGHEEGARDVPAVHRGPAEDVEEVRLRNAVAADAEGKARENAVDIRAHVAADAENVRRRVLLVAPPRVLGLDGEGSVAAAERVADERASGDDRRRAER